MSLQQLSPDWQTWVRDNLARGCTPASMLPLMQQGGFSAALSQRALDEAAAQLGGRSAATQSAQAARTAEHSPLAEHVQALAIGAQPQRGRPHIDLEANTIQCSDGQLVRIAAVLDAPQVVLFESLLSDEECLAMIALADTRLTRSTVVDEQLGEARPHEHRTSAGAWFQRGESELVARIEARLAEVLHWPVDRGEGLQVLRYAIGGEYRAHFDWFNPAHSGSTRHLQQGGQRVGTCVMYLDEVEAGGATRFPNLGYEVRPRRGAALYFADVDSQGVEDPSTLHAGVPVTRGVKYIATKWLRERTYG
ncbi:2OG-Fe(II) oxygenase [Paucibacter sp. APW11]|uniref:2OG-Fe(II) oxygenase n=1 Tax=Roseateles aquae TaxID=3077235 RepID=A0ABU3PC60_9BURK|nr:2OG-Fe(II) oxygenase [Paucibacter sp. APW11]MDT9000164.1 2OG-Fe(II) oxygenase [Paucibacter sp. APW11]